MGYAGRGYQQPAPKLSQQTQAAKKRPWQNRSRVTVSLYNVLSNREFVSARILIALLEDKSTYARLARGARKRFEANYTAELVGPQLMNFLLEIAG